MAAFHQAVALNDLAEVMRMIIEDPALVNTPIGPDLLPHQTAAFNGHLGVLTLLLDHGAPIDHQSQDHVRWTALSIACARGLVEVVALLLERGADPSIRDNHASTPLIQACTAGHVEVVRCLLRHGLSPVNAVAGRCWTALTIASRMGCTEVVKLLLQSGADPHAGEEGRNLPVVMARRYRRRDCVILLEVRDEA